MLVFSGDFVCIMQAARSLALQWQCSVLARSGAAESQTLVWLIGLGLESQEKQSMVSHKGGDMVSGPGRASWPQQQMFAGC